MRIRTTDHRALEITIRDGLIASIQSIPADANFPFCLPSFCDLQINGGMCIGFSSFSLTSDRVRLVANECRKHDTTLFLPTVITSSFDTINHAFTTLTTARTSDAELARVIPGFHLEGPYLSEHDGPRGAHPREHIRDPDWDEFQRWQEAAEGRIRLVTLAPERPGAIRFIEKLVEQNVIVSIGHTMANRDQLNDAVLAGATLSTHLGNGIGSPLPRHDNPIWYQLGDDRLAATIIADGHHLPHGILKSILRAKPKLMLISDASPLAGMPPGRYSDWGQEFEVNDDGRIVMPGTPYLAGAGCFLDRCVSHLIGSGLASEADIERMACIAPREFLGLPIPQLHVGSRWDDFILLDHGMVTSSTTH